MLIQNVAHGPLTKQGNKWLRWAFIEAVTPAAKPNCPRMFSQPNGSTYDDEPTFSGTRRGQSRRAKSGFGTDFGRI
jgi:hypothetical protein